MLIQLAIGLILTVPCMTIHVVGILVMFNWLGRKLPSLLERLVLIKNMLALCQVFLVMLGLHIVEIFIWAAYYSWQDCFEDFQMSLYYSFSAYTTVGYGDALLPPTSRLVGSIETCVGVLLFGYSTAFFWNVVNRFLSERLRRRETHGKHESDRSR